MIAIGTATTRRALAALVGLLGLVAWMATAGAAQDMRLPEPVAMDGDPAARIVLDGNTAFLRGDLRAAAADYRSALRRKPDFAVANFNLGLVEAHEGQRARGLSDMDRGISLASRHGMSAAYVSRLRALRAAFAAQPAPA